MLYDSNSGHSNALRWYVYIVLPVCLIAMLRRTKRAHDNSHSQITRSCRCGEDIVHDLMSNSEWNLEAWCIPVGLLLWNVMPAQWGNVWYSNVRIETRVGECSGRQRAHRNEIRPLLPHPTQCIPFASYADCWIYANRTMLDWCRVPLWRPLLIQLPFPIFLTPIPLFLELKSGIYLFAVALCDLIYSSSLSFWKCSGSRTLLIGVETFICPQNIGTHEDR